MKNMFAETYETTDTPLEDGDVAVVIRKNGRVQTMVKDCSDPNCPSAEADDILTAYGVTTLLGEQNLIEAARQQAVRGIEAGMEKRTLQ